jgi:Tfp pilus assembly protein PilF
MSRADFKKHFNRGRQLAGKRSFTAAIAEFEAALQHKPSDPQTIFQLGNMSKAMSFYDIAIKWYDVALRLQPGSDEIAFNRAHALQLFGRNQDALDAYSILLPTMKTNPMIWNNLGTLYQQMSETLKAIEYLETAIKLKPTYFEAWNNLGLSYFINQRENWPEAFKKAERQFKGDPNFHVNRATCHFLSGNYNEGWADYAFRHSPKLRTSVIYEHKFPLWQGEDLSGKTLLIGEEQGIGDQICFISMLAELSAKAGKIILEVNPKLVPLIQRNFPEIQVVAPQSETTDMKRHHYYNWLEQSVDYFAPLGDAFHLMRPSLESFPCRQSFLTADTGQRDTWRARLKAVNSKPKVGLSWRSSKTSGQREEAYLQFEEILPLVKKMDQFQFVNLQYGDYKKEINQLEPRPDGSKLIESFEDLDLFNDIENTCALIDSLDFVLSARNTQACFAGALGTKTICFRGSHFQFGHRHFDPILCSTFSLFPDDFEPPILEQFESALLDYEASFTAYTRKSGEWADLDKRDHASLNLAPNKGL